jgi:hypothetical protein
VLVLFAVCAGCAQASAWVPPQRLTWYWQLQGSPKVEPVQATDFDGFDNSAATVAGFHALGQRAICYINAGTWENWRSDAGGFPSSVLGSSNGWPGERWLDVRQLSVLEPIMAARFQMCAQKGFDAVEPDNIDGWGNSTGFPITAGQQLTYDEWVANDVHSLGMAVFQKNDPEQASQLEPYFDGALDEQCNQYSECSSFQSYLSAGKPVLNAEYSSSLYPGFCAADNAAGIMGALYNTGLDGASYQSCFGPSTSGPPIVPSTPGPPIVPGVPGVPGSPPARPRTSSTDTRDPVVGIRLGRLADRLGSVGVRLSCPIGQSYCDGTLELTTVRRFAVGGTKHHRVLTALVLGLKHFRIAGGHSALIRVTLKTKAVRRLGNASSSRVGAVVRARDAASRHATTRRSGTLILRK